MKNCLKDCSTTVDNITNGKAIYGPLVPVLKGKMVRRRPQYRDEVECIPIPSPVLSNHPSDSVSVDFFFIEQRPYLLMKSRVYKFHGTNACRGCSKVDTSSAIKSYLNKFGVRGVSVTTIYQDNAFEKIVEAVRPIHLEIVVRGQHVGDIERCVRTVKEGCRCTTSNLNDTYKRMPRVMIDAIVKDKIHWLNTFQPTDCIDPHTGPSGMMLGTGPPNVKYLQLDFGQP